MKGRLTGRVFLTGGTGSLGHALLDRADAEGWDCQFTVYSRDEVKQGDMRGTYPRHKFVLGDVRDLEALKLRMRGHDLVIHAGAYKQVPAAEVNVAEAIETNVIGSKNVALAAVRFGIPKVLGISTDKACAPTNAYGASKILMEKVFQEATTWGHTRFNLVRYGNVLGTRGSVVPLFVRQAQQGSITLTDPYMTRFWLTLRDAVDIVLKGIQEEEGGTVLVPMAPASTMLQLAEAVAPGADIKVIGIRPGEKTHEQLVHAGESMHADADGEWFRIFPAYAGHCGGLPPGFEYGSDTAPRLTVGMLRDFIEEKTQALAVDGETQHG
ncbi:MAG: polysaccharide biosynthesis protein [Dehalococcoidia bacterium]|nr:polysaccharide biosynthesis protein [Dehalococcoidia bacterium]